MTIDLVKGQKVDLTKGNPGLKKLVVGLGWDPSSDHGRVNFDLDASAFLLDASGKCTNKIDLVYFGNLSHPSGAVIHTGDNLTGEGDGDDEQLKVDLSLVPGNIEKIVFVVNIYQGSERNQNFGQVKNSFIRIVNAEGNIELLNYNLGEGYSKETSMIFGEIYKHNGEWKFNAVGNGSQDNLHSLGVKFGLN